MESMIIDTEKVSAFADGREYLFIKRCESLLYSIW